MAHAALDVIADHETSFNMRWEAEMRTVKRWQERARAMEQSRASDLCPIENGRSSRSNTLSRVLGQEYC
ncbi:hypothetical protein [Bradyrhizobium japonicum]|uniref:hypothetical protein n=1 Tax=Bradyrhizobium japonicum TaxID=375 RepID=UPI00057DF7B2|nr:hypothetical protein [Bradyrhizobium japonicum]MCD9113140.1 hypothetical protein [Bradyrhizobium japonicum]MCD9260500.1 hypothetical protein [Bradyrhizobium japonicum SEMIA 5079]MCD9913363.1 hypothetical protein [Bradyrhizobium japonicum]MCS3977562.1 hypothetical protein [Bradyrhizobium japonicum]WRI75714.1 hypothetical protein RZE83_21970 [Bradyrhizobium japonicum]